MKPFYVIQDVDTKRYYANYAWEFRAAFSGNLEEANHYESKKEAVNALNNAMFVDYLAKDRFFEIKKYY